MLKEIIYFFIIASGMYSTMVTIALFINDQFTHDYQWCLITSVFTSLTTSIFVYFYKKSLLKKNSSV
jgi:hypothetical protein